MCPSFLLKNAVLPTWPVVRGVSDLRHCFVNDSFFSRFPSFELSYWWYSKHSDRNANHFGASVLFETHFCLFSYFDWLVLVWLFFPRLSVERIIFLPNILTNHRIRDNWEDKWFGPEALSCVCREHMQITLTLAWEDFLNEGPKGIRLSFPSFLSLSLIVWVKKCLLINV